MKRGIKYVLLIALVILEMYISALLQGYGIQPKGWFMETLWVAVGITPIMLLLYTAGHDSALRRPNRILFNAAFWLFVVLFILGRILPYVFS